jgi:hypothetical protein
MFVAPFGEHTVGGAQVFEQVSEFSINVTLFEGAEHSGHSSASETDENVGQIKEVMFKNRTIVTHKVPNVLHIPLHLSFFFFRLVVFT